MKINSETITFTKDELNKIYNESSEEKRKALKEFFGEEIFKFDYHDIKTFEDACHHLGISYNTLYRGDGADVEAYKQANALYKLLIIQKAINNGIWRDEDGLSYYTYWVIYSKEEMERMSEEEKQRNGIKQLLSCADAVSTEDSGVRCAHAYTRVSSTDTDYGFPLCFNSEEAALYASKQFESIFFDYYGITIKK